MAYDKDPEALAVVNEFAVFEQAQNAFKGARIGKKTQRAIETMAYEGLSLPLAAKRHKIRVDNLTRAFKSQDVIKAYKQLVKHIRDNGAQAAYLNIYAMSQQASSEQVRFRASKWLAGVDGVSEVKRVQGQHHHAVTFAGFDYDDDPADDPPGEDHTSHIIEGEADEIID